MRETLHKEFLEKYLRIYPIISATSYLLPIGFIASAISIGTVTSFARFFGIPGLLASSAIPFVIKYFSKRRDSGKSKIKSDEKDYREAISMEKDYKRMTPLENENLNLFQLIKESDLTKKRDTIKIIDEIEARKLDENDLLGENIICVRKGSNKRIFIFVPGFSSNPKNVIKRAKYLNNFESIISDSSFAVFVWDTEDFWLPGNWVRAKKNTIPYSKLLLLEIDKYLEEYDQINLIGHSLGCKVIANMISNRQKPDRELEKITFLGAAVSQTEKLANLNKYRTSLFNFYSNNDLILKWLYRSVENFEKPIGFYGTNPNNSIIINSDCSNIVKGHTKYFEHLNKLMKT